MKWNKKSKKKTARVNVLADTLGKKYDEQRVIEKDAVAAKTELSEHIKRLAEEIGEPVRTMTLIKGDKFAVGYYIRMAGAKVDTDKAKTLLPKKIYDDCTVKFLDIAKLTSYVESGKIKRSIFRQMVNVGTPSKTVVVKTIKELEKELEKDEAAEKSDQTQSL
jgi:hypothetical protein